MPEVSYYGLDVFFLPVLIVLAAVVGGFIAYTLLGHYLSGRRHTRLERERRHLEEVFYRLETEPLSNELLELLEDTLDKVSGRNKVVLAKLVSGMEEPKRSLYRRCMASFEGWRSLTKRALRSPFKWRRIEAIEMLGELDLLEVYDVLSRCLEDRDEDVVYAATHSLARRSDPRAARVLLNLLGKNRVNPKRVVAMLEDFPTPIHELLWPMLRDPDPKKRAWAATLLDVSEEPETVPRLVEAAEDPDADVRSASISSLASIGDPRARKVLPKALEDEVWFVRASAARLAGTLKAAEFYEQVVCLLQDRNWWVRQNAKTALIALCPEIEEKLERYLAVDDRFTRNMVAEVLEACGAVQRRAAELEENPASEEARRFFEQLIAAEGTGAVEGMARRASPDLRGTLHDLLADRAS